MALPSHMSMPPPPTSLAQVMVVSPLYCAPNPVNFTMVRKVTLTSNTRFEITDDSDNIVFKVRVPGLTWSHPIILHDATGNPLLSLRPKMKIGSSRWKVYRGESTEKKDLLFSVKRSSSFHWRKTKLDVFLANNTREEHCDFKVEARPVVSSCVIYAGDSNSVIAQMKRKIKFFGKDRFMVSVSANVDTAFVAAIIVVLDELDSD